MNLQNLKSKLNNRIEEVFSKLGMEYEVLGDNIYSCCPVHEESDNPRAFSFSKDKGIWKCWTRECQQHFKNDIFGLISGALSKKNGVEANFSDVIKWCNTFLNVNNKTSYDKTEQIIEDDFSKLVNSINKKVTIREDFPEISIPEVLEKPSKYFLKRGFQASTLDHFDIGDCIDRKSVLYDRAIIPIHDDSGNKIVGCTGRAIKEYRSPKFLLYPTGFDKRFFLYNYHRAVEAINQTNSIFLVEGQSDVWKLYESGIKQVVGIFGRSLSKEQEYKINKLPITHVIVLLDNDQAGREAKVQIQRQLNRMYKLTFPKIPTKDVGEMTIDQVNKIIVPQVKGIKI